MAFFKFRWPGSKEEAEQPSSRRSSRNAQGDSVELLRRRARHRLIGAAVLVLLGVVGFPLLFDTQPRPIAVDVPIEIPDRNQVAPMVVPGATASMPANPRGAAPATPSASVQAENSLGDGEEVFNPTPAKPPQPQLVPPPLPEVKKPEPKPEPKVEPKKPEPKPEVKKPEPKPEPKVEPKKPEHKPESKPEPKVEHKPEPKPEPKKPRDDDADRARALLEGRAPGAAAAAKPEAAAKQEGKFIVQVGAFGDADKANDVRQKLAGAGLKAYTQTVNASAGKVTRVRVGPFNGRAEADKAAARIKGLGLPASVQPG